MTGPHPSEEGRGTVWGDVPWFETCWGGEGEGGGGGERRKMNPRLTVDAVDVELKLRTHAPLPSSILKCGRPIRI